MDGISANLPTPSGSTHDSAKSGNRPSKYRRVNQDERQRAVRACASCRRVKEKCEGGIPCKRCIHLKRQCLLTEPIKEEKSVDSSSPFVRDLLDRCKYLETIVTHHSPQQDLSLFGLRQTVSSLKSDANAGQPTPRPSSPTSDGGDLPIEDESCTIDPVDENVAHYSGEYSYWNFSMRLKQHVKDLEMHGSDQAAHETDRVPDYWRVEKLQSDPSTIGEVCKCLPPRPIADFLANVFFTHACDSYYYVERRWLETKMDLAYQDSRALKPNDAAALSILLTVFAVGSQYAPLESSLADRNRNGPPGRDEQKIGNKFYSQTVRLLPEVIHLGSLESVQACLLLALYTLPIDASGLSYIYLNLALKLGVQNGMHRKPSNNSFSPLTVEVRNRVWWSTYCLEKKVGVFHGRPLSISPADIDADIPNNIAALQSPGQPTRVAYFCISIRLLTYLEDFLDRFKSLRSDEKQNTSRIVSRLVVIKDNMNKWWESLMENGTLRVETNHPASFRSSMHVRLEYCLIRMFVGRPFLLSRRSAMSSSSPSSSASVDQDHSSAAISRGDGLTPKKSTNATMLVQECIQAANEAINICQTIRNSPAGLSQASYIEYSSCRASLLVLIAYSIHFRTDESHDILSTGLSMIKELAATGESARSEVMLIESFERALKRLSFFTEATALEAALENEKSNMDYEGFRKWGSSWQTATTTPGAENTVVFPSTAVRTQPYTGTEYIARRSQDLGWLPVGTSVADGILPTDSTGFAMFGFGDLTSTANQHYQPERQLMEHFISAPEYNMGNVGMNMIPGGHMVNQG